LAGKSVCSTARLLRGPNAESMRENRIGPILLSLDGFLQPGWRQSQLKVLAVTRTDC
jgi:hypothetical protein